MIEDREQAILALLSMSEELSERELGEAALRELDVSDDEMKAAMDAEDTRASRYDSRRLTPTQCYVLTRALDEDGAVHAHGSCMNALVTRGLVAWIPGQENKPSDKIRGRLTRRGIGLAQREDVQARAATLPSWRRPL